MHLQAPVAKRLQCAVNGEGFVLAGLRGEEGGGCDREVMRIKKINYGKKFFRAERLRLRLKAIARACCQEPWVPAPGPAQVLLPFTGLKPTQELPLLGQ